jgi:hypothetical protein
MDYKIKITRILSTPSHEQEEKKNYIVEVLSFTIWLNIIARIIPRAQGKMGFLYNTYNA